MNKLLILAAMAATLSAQELTPPPDNFILAGVSVTATERAGEAAYGRKIACIPLCIYSYSSIKLTGALTAPAYRLSSGAAIPILRRQFGQFHVGLYGLGDLGMAQSYIDQGKLPGISTLTEFVKGGGGFAAIRHNKMPQGVYFTPIAKYSTAMGPTYFLGLGYGW